jgi:hypothetical protein
MPGKNQKDKIKKKSLQRGGSPLVTVSIETVKLFLTTRLRICYLS